MRLLEVNHFGVGFLSEFHVEVQELPFQKYNLGKSKGYQFPQKCSHPFLNLVTTKQLRNHPIHYFADIINPEEN